MGIYVAHMPFIGMAVDVRSIVIFLAYLILAFSILLIYKNFKEKWIGVVELLFILVNMLFVAKYSVRVSESFAPVATLSSFVFYYFLLQFRFKIHSLSFKKYIWGVCLLAIMGMVGLQYAIDPYSVQVDRWSALHFPIHNLLSGIYPYTANTHLGGNASPFPVWQILHIPFYLLRNVGLSFFAAIALFLWSCWKVQGREKTLVICLLMCSSIAVWYEVSVRSDLITNFLFLAAIINVVFPHLNQQWVEKHQWWIACAVGLSASTRILVLIPILLLMLPYFIKMNWRNQIAVTLLTSAVFALTFVPFAVWDWHEFYYFHNNPWSLQVRQGNLSDFILFIPLAIFLSMNYKGNSQRYFRNTAVMLVIFIAVTFVHNMYIGENWDLFSSTYDITYFSTALPFCLLAIGEKTIPDR